MNIFYSWQADTPDLIGKAFIRLALDDAVSKISDRMNLDEAERPNVDQDTQGVMGSPAIAETIFEKIHNSEVVVVDVTLVGKTPEGKKLINSNVAYELGFAHGHHGDQVLLAVMNSHYGCPDDLPFDLKHRRWPVRFELSPDATKIQRRKMRQALAKEFAGILRLYIKKCSPGKKHESMFATANPATYWQDGELLVQRTRSHGHDGALELGYTKDQPLIYLRIWPDELMEEFSGRELSDYQITEVEPLLGRTGGYSCCRNKYGIITYAGGNAGELFSTTQVFKNREIWGVEAFILRGREDYDFKFVPTGAFEIGLIRSLNTYLRLAFERLGYPDRVHVKAGMVNVEGFKLAMPADYWDKFWGPIFVDVSVQTTVNKNEPESVNAALLKIFEAVFDAAGTERPESLHNFPAA